MSDVALVTEAPSHRSDLGRALAWAGLACWLVGAAGFALDLWLRPPCPDGYVRLVDVTPACLALCLIGAAVSAGLVVLAQLRGSGKVLVVVLVLILVLAALFALGGVLDAVHGLSQGDLDGRCWTF